MWTAQQECSKAVKVLKEYTVELPRSVTWTADDSRRLVAALKRNGDWKRIEAARSEYESAIAHYKEVARSTISRAQDIALWTEPDSRIVNEVRRQPISNIEQGRLLRECSEMWSTGNLDHHNALVKEATDFCKLFAQKSRPFTERYSE